MQDQPVPFPFIGLNNDVQMPQIGLGVWQAADGPEVELAVKTAIEKGYRLIDTAAIYGNEAGVGRAIKESGIAREEIFVTTKVWNSDQGFETTLKAYDESLKRLGMDYVDLYLIHWPVPQAGQFIDTWRALEKIYTEKRVRGVGVSNFKPAHLQELLDNNTIVPAVNQIELHPKLQQLETRNFCKEHDIIVESYSPIMRGGELLSDPLLQKLSDKHQKTPAQIVLRWHIQSGFVVIPKSVTPARIEENIQIFDFELDNEDIAAIADMNEDRRIGADPDNF
jgi:diketogulonate reductase-like aldo/keto reductase